MLRLLKRDVVPPDEFRYTHYETGHVSRASDYWTWQDRIREHRKANNLPAIKPEDTEEQLCKQLGPEWCSYEDSNAVPVTTRMTVADVVNGMRVFGAWMARGFQTVPQAEAERRANICARCYLNTNVEGCGACHSLAEMLAGLKKKTAVDEKLKVCAVCKCLNRGQAHAPLEVLAPHAVPDVQAQYPEFCWQKIGGENFNLEDTHTQEGAAATL